MPHQHNRRPAAHGAIAKEITEVNERLRAQHMKKS
jgi:hypothetical protein